MKSITTGSEGINVELRQALKTASDFKRALDEHAIVAIADADGKITYVNDKFCKISGYSESELMGQDHRILNSGYHPKEFYKELWATIKSGSVWHGEIRNRRKDGAIYWVDTTIVPFLDEQERAYQYIAIRVEITERKAHEERLREVARKIDQKNGELQSMIHAVSHDLRSPLVNVQGFVSILEKQMEELNKIMGKTAASPCPDANDKIHREMNLALEYIQAGTIKMDSLLNGLLSVSRVESDPYMIQDLDVNDVVRSSLDAMKFQIMAAQAKFTTHNLPMVQGDRNLLGRVFSNLFENALKFASPERLLALEIHGELDGTTAIIKVSDNGMGMDGSHIQRIFDLFYQMDSNNSEGSGIGLAIVKAALERMDGSISVSSELTEGSVFTLTLPSCTPTPSREHVYASNSQAIG